MGQRVIIVVGARPNFMKAGPVLDALKKNGRLEPVLLHTGQHYDERMSDLFFRDLGLPQPDVNLGVGSASHARQTGDVMVRFEEYLAAQREQGGMPVFCVVVGDVNSTLACSVVAAKAGIPLAHVEAGLRSFDRGMPEELNRICTDQLADVLYVTEAAGIANLGREGRRDEHCLLVGNTMIDTLLRHREAARAAGDRRRTELGVDRRYVVCTLHRPSNVDEPGPLAQILDALVELSAELPILWPIHPRTRARMSEFGLADRLVGEDGIRLIEPQGYFDFLGLMDGAALLLTDSGGIQEEATVLKVPCVTLRDNTERPVTLEMGGNILAGNDRGAISLAIRKMLELDPETIGTPPLWDGRAGERIAADLEARVLASAAADPPSDALDAKGAIGPVGGER